MAVEYHQRSPRITLSSLLDSQHSLLFIYIYMLYWLSLHACICTHTRVHTHTHLLDAKYVLCTKGGSTDLFWIAQPENEF